MNERVGSARIFGILICIILVITLFIAGNAVSDALLNGAKPDDSADLTTTAPSGPVHHPETQSTVVPTPTVDTVGTATQFPTPTASPIPTSQPSPTATLTPTATISPTDTPTPTETSEFANEKYDEFVGAVFGEAQVDAEVPIRVRAWTVAEGNSLIIILNLTAESESDVERAKAVNTLVTGGYAQAVAHHDTGKIGGKITDRLRIAEINNTGATPKTMYVNTSLAREYYTGQINAVEFTEEYWDTERNMTAEEIEFVRNLDTGTGNQTLYNETAD